MSMPRRPSTVATVLAIAVPFAGACSKNPEPTIVTVSSEPASGGPTEVAIVPAALRPTTVPMVEAPGVWTGVVTCNQPNVLEFDAAGSEVVSFEATLGVVSGSANPDVTLVEGTEPVVESGNPVGIGGAAYPDQQVTGRRTYNFRHDGHYALRVSVQQCEPVRYRVVLTRDVPASTNLTQETATAILPGTPATGTLGCEEHRWYAFDAPRRGTYHVALAGTGRIEGAGGDTSISLMTADGPVMASGNPVAAGGMLTNPAGETTTRDIQVPRPGRYFLDMTFWNGCTIADYQLTITR